MKISSRRNRRKTAPEIQAEMNNSRSNPVSLTTVIRRLEMLVFVEGLLKKNPYFDHEIKREHFNGL